MTEYILTLHCEDQPGIVAAIASRVASFGGNINEAQQFDDHETGRFFMRVAFSTNASIENIEANFGEDVERFGISHSLQIADRKPRVLILVSKFDHCLGDLLYRTRTGELNMECVGIVSNHSSEVLSLTANPDIPYHHFPIDKASKPAQEALIKQVIEATGAELVVLARYMQILSDDFSAYLSGRCINIHHSFLPGFKGAKPYHQAHERGVKMIGATAHYVTENLDEGQIIAQDVEHVTHADRPDALVRIGRDIERRVLAKAVSLHLQGRVMVNGRKTVVFN